MTINFFVTPKQGQNIVLLKVKRNFRGLLRRVFFLGKIIEHLKYL